MLSKKVPIKAKEAEIVVWGMQNAFTSKSTGEALPKEWLRVKEATTFSGISKPALYDLMNRGLIRNVSLRSRGQIKGTRLISFDSLRNFLDSRATGGETPPPTSNPS